MRTELIYQSRCFYCGVECKGKEKTIDHLIPVSRGGGNTWQNIVLSCKKCNNEKRSQTITEYRQFKGVLLFAGEHKKPIYGMYARVPFSTSSGWFRRKQRKMKRKAKTEFVRKRRDAE